MAMAKTKVQEYTEKFADQMIRFTPYALKKTGLVQSQAFLKMEDYLLICAPFQMSMKRGIFLVVLSQQEIAFFQQFQKKMCSVNLTFQKVGNKKPLNLFLRGSLDRVGPVKGKQNVCMMDTTIKGAPNDLVEILGGYITSFESLKTQFETFKGREIAVDQKAAGIMRFNNFVEFHLGAAKARAALSSMAVDSLTVVIPAKVPGLEEGSACSAKLYFQIYQFAASGKVLHVEEAGGGQYKVKMGIDFTPEMIEIVDDYFFRQNMPDPAGKKG